MLLVMEREKEWEREIAGRVKSGEDLVSSFNFIIFVLFCYFLGLF